MALDAPKQTSGAAPRTNTAARRCGRWPGTEARGPPRLQRAGMPLQP